MNQNELAEYFKRFETSKGYFLHADETHRLDTIDSLIANKNRYGHLACPCRLASGNVEDDKDIICPCDYCEDDVNEFGACYCILFVKEEFKDDPEFYPDIDDRRPVDKIK